MEIGIVGTGVMAQGITRLLVLSGHRVVAFGRSAEACCRLTEDLREWTDGQARKGRISGGEASAARARLRIAHQLRALAGVDFAIEVVAEALDVKRGIFQELDQVCPAGIPLASNTSSIPIRCIADGTIHPERVVGVHFMNPAHVMPLVEVVPSEHTSLAVLEQTIRLVTGLGKQARVVPDSPGFVVNRILFASLQQAMELLEEGRVAREVIDDAMKLGAHHRMGPLQLADFVGLDVCQAILEVLAADRLSQFRVPGVLRRKVQEGKLGRKSGEGFYRYS